MQLPGPFRAVVGLLATAAEEAKNLPDRAIELPMLAVSSAMQMSLRAQQRYARLAARGDEILNRRGTSDDPPPWATFDEPVPVDTLLSESRLSETRLSETLLAAGAPASTANGDDAPASRSSAPAKKASPRKTTTAGKKAAAPAQKAAEKSTARGKSVSRPRHTAPSRFDAVDDDPANQ